MSLPKLKLGDLNDRVEIELLDRGTEDGRNYGDLRLGVSVRMDDFCGSYDHVWIERSEWASFLNNVRRLDRDRTGCASCTSISPDEFELHLQVVDRAGHLAARGVLSRYHFGDPSGTATQSRIEYYVLLDPSRLREWVEAFARFGIVER